MSEKNFVGCMVGSGIGDALGAGLEGSLMRDLGNHEHRFSGKWTDDTHMMLGVAESLIASKDFDGECMTRTFIQNWEKEPWRGYGPGPPKVFRMVKSGIYWREAATRLYGGKGSYGNGAAMRVAPIGLLYYDNEKKLREAAYGSAKITHTHNLGSEGAAVQAYAVALAVQAQPDKLDPEVFLEEIMHFAKSDVYRKKLKKAADLLKEKDRRNIVVSLGNGIEAFNSVPTAIYCFTKNFQDYAHTVAYAVSLGGDTDTIGCMTGAIAGAYHGHRSLPKSWQQKLERSDYIENLAKKLWKLKFELS